MNKIIAIGSKIKLTLVVIAAIHQPISNTIATLRTASATSGETITEIVN